MVCEKILANLDVDAWRKLEAEDTVVTSWLVKRSSGDILSQVRISITLILFRSPASQHAIQLNRAQRGLEMQHAIRQLSAEDEDDPMDNDRKAQAEDMLNHIKDSYKALNKASDDDSLFDPE